MSGGETALPLYILDIGMLIYIQQNANIMMFDVSNRCTMNTTVLIVQDTELEKMVIKPKLDIEYRVCKA
jgi:hypothetical protein